MREVLILAIHLLVTFAKLLRPGGVRAVAAESLLLKHQLLISNRSRQRAPNLTSADRILVGLATLFVRPRRLPKLGALVRPATLVKFHKAWASPSFPNPGTRWAMAQWPCLSTGVQLRPPTTPLVDHPRMM